MNLDSIREQFDGERRTLARDQEVLEVLPLVTRSAWPVSGYYYISYSALSPENADEAIAEQVAHYRALNVEIEWKVYHHDQPADLRERLARQGFTIGEPEAVVILDMHARPHWMNQPSSYDIVLVRNAEQLEQFARGAAEVFGKDFGPITAELGQAIAAGSTQHLGYIAVEDGRAVSVGRLYTHPDSEFGGLYGGGTVKSHRGRGLYRAIVAARARDALELGARYLQVDAKPTSRPILERMGFVRLTEAWRCVLKPAATSI